MFDAFLQIENVQGESTDSSHANWIEVVDFNVGCEQPASGSSRSTAGGATSGRVACYPLRFRHLIDKASPKLYIACCQGAHIKKITLEVCRATGDKQVYYKVDLEDTVVSRIDTVGEGKSDESVPFEDVYLSYGKITWTYTATDHTTGKPAGNVTGSWSVVENKGQ
jgi:type VI secretion system secreted protein Hcp